LNLAKNNLGELVLPEGWRREQIKAYGWEFGFTHVDGRQQRKKPGNPEGIIVLADAIKDMGALTKLDISENNLHAGGGKALAAGIKGNQVITELSIAGNALGTESEYPYNSDMSGVTALADAIPDMRALTKLDISSNNIGAKEGSNLQRLCEASGIELANRLFV
jgi:hypothetical protein